MVLSRDQILAAQDRRFKVVPVPEWGGDIRIASFTAEDKLEWTRMHQDAKGDLAKEDAAMVFALARSIVDDEGRRVFSDTDMEALGRKAPFLLVRLFSLVSGMNVAEPIEEVAGKS